MEILTVVAIVAVVAALGVATWNGWKALTKKVIDPVIGAVFDEKEFTEALYKNIIAEFGINEEEPVVAAPLGTSTLHTSNKARRTQAIDLTGIKPIERTDSSNGKMLKGNRLYKLGVFPFTASVTKDSNSDQRVLYLCDATGKVYDWCSAADKTEHRAVTFTPDMFVGNPFIYSASDTDDTNAQFSRI